MLILFLAACSPSNPYIGEWHTVTDPKETITFYDDQTVETLSHGKTIKGEYTLQDQEICIHFKETSGGGCGKLKTVDGITVIDLRIEMLVKGLENAEKLHAKMISNKR